MVKFLEILLNDTCDNFDGVAKVHSSVYEDDAIFLNKAGEKVQPKHSNPAAVVSEELLTAVRKVRKCILKPNSDDWKSTWAKFDLSHIAHCLRRGSVSMHIQLTSVLRTRIKGRLKELTKITEAGRPDGDALGIPGEEREREPSELNRISPISEHAMLTRDLLKCEAIMQNNRNWTEDDYEEPLFSKAKDKVSKVQNKRDLRDRVFAGLSNLGKQQIRGEALLDANEKAYQAEAEDDRNVVEMEWSDDESEVEDDIPLKRTQLRPSRDWLKAHMKDVEDEGNQEVLRNQQREETASNSGGEYNLNDGRLNREKRSAKTIAKEQQAHTERTVERKICKYFNSKGCKFEFRCTMKHEVDNRGCKRDWHESNWKSNETQSSDWRGASSSSGWNSGWDANWKQYMHEQAYTKRYDWKY